jgi:hypothetical protein
VGKFFGAGGLDFLKKSCNNWSLWSCLPRNILLQNGTEDNWEQFWAGWFTSHQVRLIRFVTSHLQVNGTGTK